MLLVNIFEMYWFSYKYSLKSRSTVTTHCSLLLTESSSGMLAQNKFPEKLQLYISFMPFFLDWTQIFDTLADGARVQNDIFTAHPNPKPSSFFLYPNGPHLNIFAGDFPVYSQYLDMFDSMSSFVPASPQAALWLS